MKLTVKTLKGSHFEIRVQSNDTVMAVKKNIEDVQGKDNYPCGQQLLIHNGKVLKDESTLEENKVSEDGFLVVMLSKSKVSGPSGSSSTQPTTTAPAPAAAAAAAPTPAPSPAPVASTVSDLAPSNPYGQAVSNLLPSDNLEPIIQQLMDMGGGSWDKETVTRALRAAYNNPERAVDYLYSGIPEAAEVAVSVPNFASNQESGEAIPTTESGIVSNVPLSGGPNSSPLNMFPQEALNTGVGGGDGSLDFLRNNQQVFFLFLKSFE
ncbi:hypothetical protein GIB67_013996 [Kingdonia uniflora]|uniref:Uncharacterized protein n=1 Tax=Kingdonia uniflora TaxID=39325 RepID=A0A7J7L5I3_9MAGN|nr:hypothetical protein GIB67_013996 [Kingdonia uniflora]